MMKLSFTPIIITLILSLGMILPTYGTSQLECEKGKWEDSFLLNLHRYNNRLLPDTLPIVIDTNLLRKQIQIMVIPKAYTFEERRELIKNDPNFEVAITYIINALRERGYLVKNFENAIDVSRELAATSEVLLTDPKELLIQSADAEVLIEVNVSEDTFEGNAKQLHIQCKALDKYTSKSYADLPWSSSNKRRGADVYRHVKDALTIEQRLDHFLDQLDERIIEFGQSSEIIIESRNAKLLSLNTKLKEGGTLIRQINEWINLQPNVKFITISGYTNRLFRLQAQNQQQKYDYKPFHFGMDLRDFIDSVLKKNNSEFKEVELKVVGKRIYIYIK